MLLRPAERTRTKSICWPKGSGNRSMLRQLSLVNCDQPCASLWKIRSLATAHTSVGPVPLTLGRPGEPAPVVDAGNVSSSDQQPWSQCRTCVLEEPLAADTEPTKNRSSVPAGNASVTWKPSSPAGGAISV